MPYYATRSSFRQLATLSFDSSPPLVLEPCALPPHFPSPSRNPSSPSLTSFPTPACPNRPYLRSLIPPTASRSPLSSSAASYSSSWISASSAAAAASSAGATLRRVCCRRGAGRGVVCVKSCGCGDCQPVLLVQFDRRRVTRWKGKGKGKGSTYRALDLLLLVDVLLVAALLCAARADDGAALGDAAADFVGDVVADGVGEEGALVGEVAVQVGY